MNYLHKLAFLSILIIITSGNTYAACIKGDCINGYGQSNDNGNYIGEFKNGQKHGWGSQDLKQSNSYSENYKGQWKNGRQDGQGTIIYSMYKSINGGTWTRDIYQGEWKQSRRHGKGTYTWANGSRFIGIYKNDKRTSQGNVIYDPCISIKFIESETTKNQKNCLSRAKKGNVFAQYNLAKMLTYDNDYIQAVKWFKKASKKGHDKSQYELAKIFREGERKVKKNNKQYGYWLKKAAKQGHENAQYDLSILYKFGYEENKLNYKKEYVKWMRKSADNGFSDAQYYMSRFYGGEANDGSIIENIVQEAQWAERAAKQGDYNAKLRIAYMYKAGLGVSQDYVKAYMWWQVSGDRTAKKWIAELASDMPERDISKAKYLANHWIETPENPQESQ